MSRIRADRYTNREGTGAPTFSEGVNVVGVTSMSGDLAVTNGTITGPSQLTISGITSSISDTAVDVFVYDTSKDSDGGAWRKRTQNTSWYNETLNTATRGSRKEFPSVAVFVAEAAKVTIYDGDDPDLPMWMVFNAGTGRPLYSGGTTAVVAVNGQFWAGSESAAGALSEFYFIKDYGELRITTTSSYNYRTIVNRNVVTTDTITGTTQGIVNRTINDVAMTVLPNAPIDSATGLPTPTIAVATAGGVSVIKDDGTVVDITASAGSSYSSSKFISISSDGLLVFPQHGSSATSGEYSLMTIPIPSSDRTTQTNSSNATDKYIFNDPNSSLGSLPHGLGFSQNGALRIPGTQFLNYPNGLAILDEHPTTLSKGMVAYIKSDHNTGWMQGNIKGAFLSDTDDTDKTNGQTDPDRSVNNNALTVTGTITKSAVATGAELVAYGPFSSSNYMDNTSFSVDFGNPPTISIIFWQKITDITDYGYAISFSAGTTIRGGISNGASSTGYAGEAYFNMGSQTLYTGVAINDGNWHCLVGTVNATSKKFYLDGKEVESATISNYDMSGVDKLHVGSYGTTHAYAHRGSLALLRVSKTELSSEQIKKMYDDERWLFQDNAKATLYGSSDAVTALEYDDTTDLLHVGTSAGRSEFQGLKRINNTTVGITTAISASNGLVAEQ